MSAQKTVPKPKFELGMIVATPGALEVLKDAKQSFTEFVLRHEVGDWGDVEEEDRLANERAIAHEGDPTKQLRVMSVYLTNIRVKIWVMTEWDRSSTTILLPEDY
jgi:hypothetical protein